MKPIIKIFYDVETTGTDPRKHSIHQLSGLIEVNGEIVEKFNIKSRPHERALYEPAALRICGKTEEELKAYHSMHIAHSSFKKMLSKYIDQYDPSNKAYLIGFNNRAFDDIFLRMWFELCGDNFIGSWFYNNTLDTLVLATEYLIPRRIDMPSFKLKRVAKELGIEVNEEALHDASYDVVLTRQIYRIVTGLDLEI